MTRQKYQVVASVEIRCKHMLKFLYKSSGVKETSLLRILFQMLDLKQK